MIDHNAQDGALARDLLIAAVRQLTVAGVVDAPRDARILLAHALEIAPSRLTLVLPDPVSGVTQARFEGLIARRAAREPVSHLVGERHFYGRRFRVSGAVLDPRPETETLIEHALRAPFDSVLDLGTGTGCILLTLLAECPRAVGLGTDLSPDALDVAQENRARMSVEGRADLRQGSWYAAVPRGARYDLIVSNPPYIAAAEMAGLSPEVLGFEPRMALTDEGDGLSAYRLIAAGAQERLSASGRLAVEIGPSQGGAVAAIFSDAGLHDVAVEKDMDGRDRVVVGANRLP